MVYKEDQYPDSIFLDYNDDICTNIDTKDNDKTQDFNCNENNQKYSHTRDEKLP